jgi:hypothetical protein
MNARATCRSPSSLEQRKSAAPRAAGQPCRAAVRAHLLVTGVGAALVFFLVKRRSFVGRELQDMVWLRHRRGRADPPRSAARERFLLGGA